MKKCFLNIKKNLNQFHVFSWFLLVNFLNDSFENIKITEHKKLCYNSN